MRMPGIKILSAALAILIVPFAMAGKDPRMVGNVEVHAPKSSGIFGFGGDIAAQHWGRLQAPTGQDWSDCTHGRAQSPIDFSDAVVKAGNESPIQVRYKPVPLTFENLGTTIEVPYQNGSHIIIDKVRYNLIQFHLHTPSEHTMNGGAHFPLEIHFVHAAESGALAVLGALVKEGLPNAAVSALGSPIELDQMIPRNENVNFVFKDVMLDGEKLLPKNRSFFRYNGSLTTPPCSETVLWSVFKTPIEMSGQQLRVFRDALGSMRFAGPEGQNNRPVQPVNDRKVTINQ